jgi:hypothetical protein
MDTVLEAAVLGELRSIRKLLAQSLELQAAMLEILHGDTESEPGDADLEGARYLAPDHPFANDGGGEDGL